MIFLNFQWWKREITSSHIFTQAWSNSFYSTNNQIGVSTNPYLHMYLVLHELLVARNVISTARSISDRQLHVLTNKSVSLRNKSRSSKLVSYMHG